MQIYRTVVGNNSPDLVFTVQRQGTVIDVTGATVQLFIRNERTNDTMNSSQAGCNLTTPGQGKVTYPVKATDFPTEDRYICDIKVTYASGKVEYIYEEVQVLARGAIS